MTENKPGIVTFEGDDTFESGSLFADLQAEAAKDIERETLLLKVEGREGWAVEYDGEISFKEIKALTKRSQIKNGSKDPDVDPVKLSCLTLLSLDSRLVKIDKATDKMLGYYPNEVGLTHEEFITAFGPKDTLDSVAALVKFMGEAGVNQHAAAALEWLGLNGTAERVNSTSA